MNLIDLKKLAAYIANTIRNESSNSGENSISFQLDDNLIVEVVYEEELKREESNSLYSPGDYAFYIEVKSIKISSQDNTKVYFTEKDESSLIREVHKELIDNREFFHKPLDPEDLADLLEE